MKNQIKILLVSVVMVFSLTDPAGALLIDNGDGTVTDDDLGLMWLQSPGADSNFSDAVSWADSLVFAGHDDWRLPSVLDFGTGLPDEDWFSTNNEFGHLYGTELGNPANLGDIVPLTGYNPVWYWTGTTDPDSPGDAYVFFWSFDGLWLAQSTADGLGVQPTSTSDVLHVTAVRVIDGGGNGNGNHEVPEPSTLFLLGSGLAGLAALRRKLST